MRNQEVAKILHEVADILELQGVKFKPQAYRKAAQSIESLEEPIETVKDFDSIPGVGEAIARKITEILETGNLEYLLKIKKEIPEGMGQLMQLPEIGPKTAKFLAIQGITTVEELEKAVKDHSIQKMKGFGPKTEDNLKRALQLYKFQKERRLLGRVLPLCGALEEGLHPFCETVVIAGSVRRWKETIGDIDVLAISTTPENTIKAFTELSCVEQVLSKGNTKSTAILRGGIQTDLRVVPSESFGSALQYFTGSKEHNIKIRKRALRKGFKLNEYGLFDRKSGTRVGGESEEDIYTQLGLLFIPPELREDHGEIEAAQSALPHLIDMNSIKGDFHVHTQWSDGRDSIEVMVSKARERHYAYIGICDHSVSSRIARGLPEEKLLNQNEYIKELNDRTEGIEILSGVECDIKPDGSLDYPDSVLEQLDFVTASIHSRFKSSREECTNRLVKAMENSLVTVIGHPTGRIIGRRDPLPLDLEAVYETAQETKTALEINCYPDRLDLKDTHVREAKKHHVLLALGTDAHSIQDLKYMELGVGTARRGWAEPENVMNTFNFQNSH